MQTETASCIARYAASHALTLELLPLLLRLLLLLLLLLFVEIKSLRPLPLAILDTWMPQLASQEAYLRPG